MGESKKDALRVNFDRKLKLEFHGVKVTSDAGLLAYRELDEVLGLTTMIESDLTDSRTGKNTQHGLLALLRQSVYSLFTVGWLVTMTLMMQSVCPLILAACRCWWKS